MVATWAKPWRNRRRRKTETARNDTCKSKDNYGSLVNGLNSAVLPEFSSCLIGDDLPGFMSLMIAHDQGICMHGLFGFVTNSLKERMQIKSSRILA